MISLNCPYFPLTYSATQAGLKLSVLLPQYPEKLGLQACTTTPGNYPHFKDEK
jgi:hypothetical protein